MIDIKLTGRIINKGVLENSEVGKVGCYGSCISKYLCDINYFYDSFQTNHSV